MLYFKVTKIQIKPRNNTINIAQVFNYYTINANNYKFFYL